MSRIRWQDRVVIDLDLHHGEACIHGMRVPVAIIIGSLADGLTNAEIRRAYPQLKDEDIRAALAYAAVTLHTDVVAPLCGVA